MTTCKKRSRSKADALVALKDLLSGAQIYQSKSKDIHAKFLSMKDRYNLPRYEWEYLQGYYDAIVDGWYRHNLAYATFFEGKLYDNEWDKLPRDVQEYISKTNTQDLSSGHFWKNTDGTIGKPFFATNIVDY